MAMTVLAVAKLVIVRASYVGIGVALGKYLAKKNKKEK